MSIILQIYWLTVLASVLSTILNLKLRNVVDPFEAMKDMQESLDSLPDKWAKRCSDFFEWLSDNAPFSMYITIATFSMLPLVNLIYSYSNIKQLIDEDKEN